MKNIIKFLFLALTVSITITSCKDAYEIEQDGVLDDAATFQSVSDMNKYLNGSVYGSMDNSSEIMFTSLFTDEVGYGPSGGDDALHRFYLDVSDGNTSAIWLTYYNMINKSNRLIEGATKVTPTDVAAYNSIIAQARLVRAYAYMQLESFFSTDMQNDSALGVILLNKVPDINEDLPRVANSEIFALMDEDFEFADSYLVDHSTNSYYYMNRNFLNGLRARYYLYRGNHTLAKQYAQAVLDTSGLSLTSALPIPTSTVGTAAWNNQFYGINSTNPYRKLWNDSSQGENIFAINRTLTGIGGNIARLFTTNSTTVSGSVLYDMGRNLFNILDASSGDVRRRAFVDPTSRIDTNYLTSDNHVTSDIIVIDKYPGKGNQPLKNDLKVMRLSEMYFILAECAADEGDLTAAATYLKAVRDARNYIGATTLDSYSSAAQAYAAILHERRVELCYEGFRYLDIKRLGTLAGGVSIDRNITDDRVTTLPTTIALGDYRWTLPIPKDETTANPTIVQNPGY